MDDSQSNGGYNYLFGEADGITRRIEEYRRQHGINDDSPPFVSPEHLSENISHTMNCYQAQSQPTMSTPYNSIPAEHHSQDSSQMIYHHQFQNQPIIRRLFCWKCLMSMLISWPMRFFAPTNRSRPIGSRPLPSNTPPPSIPEHIGDRPNQHSIDEIVQRARERERLARERSAERRISNQHSINEIIQRARARERLTNTIGDRSNQHSIDEIIQRARARERLAERQISQLPTIGDRPNQHSIDEIIQRARAREGSTERQISQLSTIGDRPNQHSIDDIIQRSRARGGIGLTERQISQLPTIKFKPSIEDKKCMICQSDYARGEKMTILPCTHKYHQDCIGQWLKNSKLCCVCQREVVVRN